MATDRKIEVEAKYRVVTPGGADRYLVTPDLGPLSAQGAVTSMRIEDRYVDSADWALARAGYAARLRKTPRGVEIGLKSRSSSGGAVHRREEIEGPADVALEPSGWPPSAARDVVMEHCGDSPLLEIVTVRQLRRVRQLASPESTAELSVDEVEVVSNGETLDRFEELEVEIKSSDESCLPAVVEILNADPALRAQSRSKFERAVKAARGAMDRLSDAEQARWAGAPDDLAGSKPRSGKTKSPKSAHDRPAEEPAEPEEAVETVGPEEGEAPNDEGPVSETGEPAQPALPAPSSHGKNRANKPDARTIGIAAADSMPEAARKVLEFHFRRLKNREAGTRAGTDPEELHSMRVAARRMRAAWRVFDGSFKPSRTRKIRRRLGVLADRLGTVRDLDVLLGGLEVYRDNLEREQRAGLDPLITLWRKQRNEARTQLIAELDSKDYSNFLEDMDEFLESGAHSAASVIAPTSPHRVRDKAPSEIWASYESVRVYELVLPWADVETLHALRISTKWLRYTLEFFGELLGPDGALLLSRVGALQDHLGGLHDADVAAKLTRDVLVARAGELSRAETAAIGAYLQSREREVARRRRALGTVWRAVDGAPFRRALGRATATV